MNCEQPGCGGTIADGYCDLCGMAPAPVAASAPAPAPSAAAASAPSAPSSSSTRAPGAEPSTTTTSRLGSVAIGSARSGSAPGSGRTRRLAAQEATSRLGAGITNVAPAPALDPMSAVMADPTVSEDKRNCASCQEPVGRSRPDRPGRTAGFCPKCGTRFNFDPTLGPGTVVGGQYEVVGCIAHGGMGWVYLARDRNVNDRWVVLKGLLNAGDEDGYRAAVAEKGYLAEVEHPLIVEIYNFVTATDGTSYIVMEYVGGRAVSTMLKDRMAANHGAFDPIPLDQALALIIEVLSAFSYLHAHGLVYCDFKPANLMQVADSIKLIDLGGVRKIDDDVSPIYGTIGFQAPEVAAVGATIPADIFTIARTLAVMTFEFRGYQSRFVASLPPVSDVAILAEFDSYARLLARATAARPEDRFQTAEEFREQALGVLREVVASQSATPAATTRATPSSAFGVPTAATDQLEWNNLPPLRAPVGDPMADWLNAGGEATLAQLQAAPVTTLGVRLAIARQAIAENNPALAQQIADQILAEDPWEWRALWVQGLLALSTHSAEAVDIFNTVYGEIPGELAPKLALARACELAGQADVAERMYAVCARTDAAYIAAAQFGLARLSAGRGDQTTALDALDRIPASSRSWAEARRQRALILALPDTSGRFDLRRLSAALDELNRAGVTEQDRLRQRLGIFNSALGEVRTQPPSTTDIALDGVPVDERSLQFALERTYRDLAMWQERRSDRIAMVDTANAVRPRTLR